MPAVESRSAALSRLSAGRGRRGPTGCRGGTARRPGRGDPAVRQYGRCRGVRPWRRRVRGRGGVGRSEGPLAGGVPLTRRPPSPFHFGHLLPAPKDEHRAGHEDGRVAADQDPYRQRESEVAQHGSAEEQQGHYRHEHVIEVTMDRLRTSLTLRLIVSENVFLFRSRYFPGSGRR